MINFIKNTLQLIAERSFKNLFQANAYCADDYQRFPPTQAESVFL